MPWDVNTKTMSFRFPHKNRYLCSRTTDNLRKIPWKAKKVDPAFILGVYMKKTPNMKAGCLDGTITNMVSELSLDEILSIYWPKIRQNGPEL